MRRLAALALSAALTPQADLRFDGNPLWSKPPAPPSETTKALLAESLRRRHSDPEGSQQ
jgi:hypothetical protein